MPRDDTAVLVAGWAVKQGRRLKSSWKRRFFVLRSATDVETALYGCTHMLAYYKSEKHVQSG
jgi:hypothetical protein